MKITCPSCFRQLDTLDPTWLPAHAHTPLLGERCVAGDKTLEEATKLLKDSMRQFKARIAAKKLKR